ncbi:MAG: hypothetical protein QXW37_06525 [Candidatus Nitrosotenuis sp.]
MRPSRYVKMARTMMQIIKRARIPPYLHRKSNHVYKVWQHLILLMLRQYEHKSYRRFVEFLQEAFGVGEFLGLSRIPHHTTLQKAASRLTHGMLIRILESFVISARIRKFAGTIPQDCRTVRPHITTPNLPNYEGNSSRYRSVLI